MKHASVFSRGKDVQKDLIISDKPALNTLPYLSHTLPTIVAFHSLAKLLGKLPLMSHQVQCEAKSKCYLQCNDKRCVP